MTICGSGWDPTSVDTRPSAYINGNLCPLIDTTVAPVDIAIKANCTVQLTCSLPPVCQLSPIFVFAVQTFSFIEIRSVAG
jgi:hypothetical protein